MDNVYLNLLKAAKEFVKAEANKNGPVPKDLCNLGEAHFRQQRFRERNAALKALKKAITKAEPSNA